LRERVLSYLKTFEKKDNRKRKEDERRGTLRCLQYLPGMTGREIKRRQLGVERKEQRRQKKKKESPERGGRAPGISRGGWEKGDGQKKKGKRGKKLDKKTPNTRGRIGKKKKDWGD